MNEFLTLYASVIALTIRLVALVICAFLIVPLQFRQIRVKDGLRRLRHELLAFGVVHALTNVVTIYLLLDIIGRHSHQRLLNGELQIINAVGFLLLALIAYSIYHSRYTD